MEGAIQPLTRGRMIEDRSIVGRKMLADCFDGRWMIVVEKQKLENLAWDFG